MKKLIFLLIIFAFSLNTYAQKMIKDASVFDTYVEVYKNNYDELIGIPEATLEKAMNIIIKKFSKETIININFIFKKKLYFSTFHVITGKARVFISNEDLSEIRYSPVLEG